MIVPTKRKALFLLKMATLVSAVASGPTLVSACCFVPASSSSTTSSRSKSSGSTYVATNPKEKTKKKGDVPIGPPRTKRFATSISSSGTEERRTVVMGPRIGINEDFPGLELIRSNPDIYVVRGFLDDESCADLIREAMSGKRAMERSPVAYAGWTDDVRELLGLAARGPVAWIAIIAAYLQVTGGTDGASQIDLVVHSLRNYAVVFLFAAMAIGLYTKLRADGLSDLRTSTSTTLDDLSDPNGGTTRFVVNAADLLSPSASASSSSTTSKQPQRQEQQQQQQRKSRYRQDEASRFEAPTVIRYESGQVLAPHFDANRSAETEDANRGGQTLATLLVYLNDVKRGGLTRFGRLPASTSTSTHTEGEGGGQKKRKEEEERDDDVHLTIRPRKGDALLFFPADAKGQFDERTEHEGCAAMDEKFIARIWRHSHRVPPPFGLAESELSKL